jgi:uncharacterized protein (DUF2267 family)
MEAKFEEYAQDARRFIETVARQLGTPADVDHAYRVTQAVIQSIRNHIPVEESMEMIAQLPMILKAMYVNGWRINKERKRYHSKEELLQAVCKEADRAEHQDFRNNCKEAVQAVLRTIKMYVDAEELVDVRGQMPDEVAELMYA